MNSLEALALLLSKHSTSSSEEDIVRLLMVQENLRSEVRSTTSSVSNEVCDWLRENKREDVTVGETVYYPGVTAQWKPHKFRELLTAIIVQCDEELELNDVDKFSTRLASYLSTNSIKPGACRKVFGEVFSQLFDYEIKRDDDNQPITSLKSTNQKYYTRKGQDNGTID